jgi:hypothetical protein
MGPLMACGSNMAKGDAEGGRRLVYVFADRG